LLGSLGSPEDAIAEDTACIKGISFVPTANQINKLIVQSDLAEKQRLWKIDGLKKEREWKITHKKLTGPAPLLSKHQGAIPKSFNPDNTILAKIARGDKDCGPDGDKDCGLGGTIGDKNTLTIIDDLAMPFGFTSNGPNGVLTDCAGKTYGTKEKPRINLFYKNKKETFKLLRDYLALRMDKELDILDLFVKKLKLHDKDGKFRFKLKAENNAKVLDSELEGSYSDVVSLFEEVALKVHFQKKSHPTWTIRNCGINVLSFCQTWMKKGQEAGEAEFTMMNPHFQTRFYVESEVKLLACGVSMPKLKSYKKLIAKHFTPIMNSEYKGSFINLDGLYKAEAFKALRNAGRQN